MSLENNNNFKNSKNILNKDNFTVILFNSLTEIEQKTKSLSMKDIDINENIRSIKLKERKIDKINQTILNKKEELKLIKELFKLKEEKNMDIKDIMDSYMDFLICSNDNIDNKLNSLFQNEININSKQKLINKLLGEDKNENDYDYIYENINRPININKFLLNPKKKKNKSNNQNRITENGGDNLDGYIIDEINNKIKNDKINNNMINNIYNDNNNKNNYQSKKNKISSSSSYEKISNGIKLEEMPYNSLYKNSNKKDYNYDINKSNSKQLKIIDENKKYNIFDSSKKYEKFITPNNKENNSILKKNDYKNKSLQIYNQDKYLDKDEYIINDTEITYRNMNKVKNFAKTDVNDFSNYNLQPNNKLKKARDIFKRLLNKLKKSNELFFTNNNNNKDNLEDFIFNVLNTKYFLRKILAIIFECSGVYNPENENKRTITETIHDSEFLSRLNNNYEDTDDENDFVDINNIRMFEKGLEEIKKISKETKQLQDKISHFAYKINVTG